MKLQFEKLENKDIKHIIHFADVGMHFDKYCTNWPLRYLYGKYYFLSELRNSTQVLALYHENQLAGVLFADIEGEEKTLYVFTDDACCYPFYNHVEFERKGEKEILIDVLKKKIPLKCFLYCRSF